MPEQKSISLDEIEREGQSQQTHQYWKYVVYPDSAPSNWKEMLDRYGRPWVESPLHTPEDEKPHWHIIVDSGKKTTYERACKLCAILGCPHPRYTQYLTRDVRYLAHLDNSKKQQFDLSTEPIVAHNGFDLKKHLEGKRADRLVTMREISTFADDRGVLDFYELTEAILEVQDENMFAFVRKNAYMVNSFLANRRAHRHASQIGKKRVLTDDNGVIVSQYDETDDAENEE